MKKNASTLILSLILFSILFLFDKQYSFAFDNTQALKKANSYLSFSAFSHDGLIKQLKYDGFTQSEAEYAANNCGADWENQALQKANRYLSFSAFSHDGLIKQLKYDGFTQSEAEYAADNCQADWKKQAIKKAQNYLSFTAFSDSGLIKQLKYDGFTEEEAVYALSSLKGEDISEENTNHKDINKETESSVNPNSEQSRAIEKAKTYLQYNYSRNKIVKFLITDGFSKEIAEYAADSCNADWNQQAVNKALDYSAYNYSAAKISKFLLNDGFTEEQTLFGIENCEVDWNFAAYNKALSYAKYNYSNEKILRYLISDGFTNEQATLAIDCLEDTNCTGLNIDTARIQSITPTATPVLEQTAASIITKTEQPTVTYTTTSTMPPTPTLTPTPEVSGNNVSMEMIKIFEKNMENIFVIRGLEEVFNPPISNTYSDVGPKTVVLTNNQEGMRNISLYVNSDLIHDYNVSAKINAGNLKNFLFTMDVRINDVYPSQKGGCYIGYTNESVTSGSTDQIKLLGLLINGKNAEIYTKGKNDDYGEHTELKGSTGLTNTTYTLTLIRLTGQTFAYINGKYAGQVPDENTGPFQLVFGTAVFNDGDNAECSFDNLIVRKVN